MPEVSQLLKHHLKTLDLNLIFLILAYTISKRKIQKWPSDLEKLGSICVLEMHYVMLIY